MKKFHHLIAAAFAMFVMFASVTLAAEDEKENSPPKAKWDVNNPPGTAISVPIDTRSGTWMSVDVSPDGKQIVFDLLGDLYLLPIEGGEATALTHSVAWEMQARFSPDGKRLTYMSTSAAVTTSGSWTSTARTHARLQKKNTVC